MGKCEKCSFTRLFSKAPSAAITSFEDTMGVNLQAVNLVWYEYIDLDFPNSKGKIRKLARMKKTALPWDAWCVKFLDSLTGTVVMLCFVPCAG